MGEAIKANGQGDLQRAFGSSSLSQTTLFGIEEAFDLGASKDDRWARYRRVRSAVDKAGNTISQIHAYAGGTINAIGGTATTPGYLGNMREHSKTIDGVSRTFITAWGLDIPIIAPTASDPTSQLATINSLTGKTNFNWAKSKFENGPLRKWDFDGYKPGASFPLEYGQDGVQMDCQTDSMDVGVRYPEVDDPLRIFLGDMSTYFFNDKMVWGAVVSRHFSGETREYYANNAILYQDANGHSFKMSDYVSQYSPYRGWVTIRVPRTFHYNVRDAVYTISIVGYIPPNSGTGKDGYAFLLPSNPSVAGQKNPINITSSSGSIDDPLLKLTFDMSAGKFGKAVDNPNSDTNMKPIPTGIPGLTLTPNPAQGVYTTSTFAFYITFTNSTNSSIALNLNYIAFDVTRYDPTNFQPLHTERASAAFYSSHSTASGISGSQTIAAGGSLKVYVSIANIWTNQGHDSTTYGVDIFNVKIVNTQYPNSSYSKPVAMFFAKYSTPSSWFFNCQWDATNNTMKIV